MHKLKQKIFRKNTFNRSAIFILALLILGLSHTAHAVTIKYNFTGHLSGVQNFLGTRYITPFTGSFSVDVGAPKLSTTYSDTTGDMIETKYSAMTQFSLSVGGMADPTVYATSTGQVNVQNNGLLYYDWQNNAFIYGDSVDLATNLDGGNVSVGGVTYAPDTADLLFRFNSLDVLTSTDLAPAIDQLDYLSLLVNSESHGYLTYRNIKDNSDTKVQYFHFDYIGTDGQFTAATNAPAPVPEPGTLVLLGSGLAGMFFFRKKKI